MLIASGLLALMQWFKSPTASQGGLFYAAPITTHRAEVRLHPVGWMGHGLQMWLQTMWFLSRAANSGTVILDEPDVYMHADLQRQLIRLLRGKHEQTVVATHSVEIMSEVESSEILVVDKTRSKSQFAASVPVVQNVIDQLGGVHNIHLARLWGSRKCLHVEGKDIILLKAFQETLFPDAKTSLSVIPRMSIGGWGGWNYAIGSTMGLRNAAGETIMSYCVFDSDYFTDEIIASRYSEATSRGIQLHVWHRKEIENYLIVPSAIRRVIAAGGVNENGLPTVKEIQDAVFELAHELEEDVFDALAYEYFIADKRGGNTNANRKARTKMNQLWDSLAGRMKLVSGKALLSKLSEWSRNRYGVSFGTKRVAREITESELAKEVRDVVRAIERTQRFPSSLKKRS